jgi:NAD(P)-dependent dehydrogenase (short-subunit alcohol dehydrogenase family)
MYLERFRLADRVAVITGAGRGIGRATADALSEAGAIVVLTDIDSAAAESAAAEIRSLGRQAVSMSLDVTNSAEVEAVCSAVLARYGRVDVLVNNAGIALGAIPAERMTDAEWARVIDINLTGVFRCCRAFGRVMLESGGGAIVNVGSMSGDVTARLTRAMMSGSATKYLRKSSSPAGSALRHGACRAVPRCHDR